MKKVSVLFFLLFLFCRPVFGQSSEESTLSAFSWLEGKWEHMMNHPNQTGYEEWERRDDSLTGLGVTIQEGDTVFVEKLFIEMKADDWYYIAEVDQNAEPTYFKISELSEEGFVSENPDHDFPKMIEYKRQENKELIVTISGDGRSVQFLFKKMDS